MNEFYDSSTNSHARVFPLSAVFAHRTVSFKRKTPAHIWPVLIHSAAVIIVHTILTPLLENNCILFCTGESNFSGPVQPLSILLAQHHFQLAAETAFLA